MRRTILLLALAMAGCGEEFSNAPLEADEDFVAAAPSATRLRLSVGAERESDDGALRQALVEEPAEFYVFTRRTVLSLNALGFNLLRAVDRAVAAPPSERRPDHRVWDRPAQGLEAHDTRFEMRREAERYSYALTQAEATTLTGEFSPATGLGALTFDLDAASAIHGGMAHGQLHVDYMIEGRAIDLGIQFDDFAPDGAAATNASYRFQRTEEGAGTFDFAFVTGDEQRVEVRSRWRPDGAGRADARVTGEADAAIITECWDETFAQVYYHSDQGTAGALEDCAFADRALPE